MEKDRVACAQGVDIFSVDKETTACARRLQMVIDGDSPLKTIYESDSFERKLIKMVLACADSPSDFEANSILPGPTCQSVAKDFTTLVKRVSENFKKVAYTCPDRHAEDIHPIIKGEILPKIRSEAQSSFSSALCAKYCQEIDGWDIWAPLVNRIVHVLANGYEFHVALSVEHIPKEKKVPLYDIPFMWPNSKETNVGEKTSMEEWYARMLRKAITKYKVDARWWEARQSRLEENEDSASDIEGQTHQHIQKLVEDKVKASQELTLQKVQDAIKAQVAEMTKVVNDGIKATNEQIDRHNARIESSKAEILDNVDERIKASQSPTYKVSDKIDCEVDIDKSGLISHIDKTIREAVMQSMSSNSEFGVTRHEVDNKIHQNMQTTTASLFNMELRLQQKISAIETSMSESKSQLVRQCNELQDEVEKTKFNPTPSFRATEKTFEQPTRDLQAESSIIEDLEKVTKAKTNVMNGLKVLSEKLMSATPVPSIQVAEQTVTAHLKEKEQAKNVNNAAKKTDNLAFQVAFPGQDTAPTAAQLWEEIKLLRAEIKHLKDTPPSSVASDPHSGNNGGAETMEKQALEDWSFLKPSEKSVGIADDVATNAAVHGSDGDSESLQDFQARLVRGGASPSRDRPW
ncbi:hypothetical protein HYALB_00006193 [Hymenoscyphus albidus]|uniref:Uncharacterized protein n=1 Tax=Hymenoscyphus albidus TaxID=595503 RepID=A0A9N9LFC3_9HELO|nr:hypothetical protein HYALB_00006193 [Hymenoscyphus albidus]